MNDAGDIAVFGGTSNPKLARRIAGHLGVPLGDVEVGRFPDGETRVKIHDNIRGKDCFVIQSICKPPNERIMELLIMMDAMKRASAQRITAVLPFYAYARQDRKDQPRVPITARLVADLLEAAGANRLLTMDLHAQQIMGFFNIPVDHLYAAPVIVKYLQGKNLKDMVVVSPDTGGVKAAYAYSQKFECGLAIVAKQRKSPTQVESFTLVGDVAGCTAVMVDDLASTAGTLCAAAEVLHRGGARRVIAAVTHAMITREGGERLKRSRIDELIVTDTVPLAPIPGLRLTVLSVAELLGEAIGRIHRNESITTLLK